jgi:hypothetical protein
MAAAEKYRLGVRKIGENKLICWVIGFALREI